MDETLALLLDEREITQQLTNYCRAMDRCDRELGVAVFHPQAEADFGAMYRGTGEGFVDFALARHRHLDAHVHRISTISICVNGDTAGSHG
jgi:SnoaL-like domain